MWGNRKTRVVSASGSQLTALINRDYLSDRQQLVPLIRDLTEDERIPLVGRNQAARILKKLEKQTQ